MSNATIQKIEPQVNYSNFSTNSSKKGSLVAQWFVLEGKLVCKWFMN